MTPEQIRHNMSLQATALHEAQAEEEREHKEAARSALRNLRQTHSEARQALNASHMVAWKEYSTGPTAIERATHHNQEMARQALMKRLHIKHSFPASANTPSLMIEAIKQRLEEISKSYKHILLSMPERRRLEKVETDLRNSITQLNDNDPAILKWIPWVNAAAIAEQRETQLLNDDSIPQDEPYPHKIKIIYANFWLPELLDKYQITQRTLVEICDEIKYRLRDMPDTQERDDYQKILDKLT